jgi:putative ABC transport system ATP-binding protein
LLRALNRSEGNTFLIVTHDADVGAACDRIIRMREGCVVADSRRSGDEPADGVQENGTT